MHSIQDYTGSLTKLVCTVCGSVGRSVVWASCGEAVKILRTTAAWVFSFVPYLWIIKHIYACIRNLGVRTQLEELGKPFVHLCHFVQNCTRTTEYRPKHGTLRFSVDWQSWSTFILIHFVSISNYLKPPQRQQKHWWISNFEVNIELRLPLCAS